MTNTGTCIAFQVSSRATYYIFPRIQNFVKAFLSNLRVHPNSAYLPIIVSFRQISSISDFVVPNEQLATQSRNNFVKTLKFQGIDIMNKVSFKEEYLFGVKYSYRQGQKESR